MDASLKDKLTQYAKSKMPNSAPSEPEDSDEESDESPMYDLACKLLEALGMPEDNADQVADVLMDLKQME